MVNISNGMESKLLQEIIWERMGAKGYNPEKIYLLTGIPKHYLDAVFAGEWQKMPAAPYARSYFKKLETALDFSVNELWQKYQEETEVLSSGKDDRLPENRFAIKKADYKWWAAGAVLIILVVYLAVNAQSLIGIPDLEISNPLSATIIATLPNYEISGLIESKDKVSINGEEVFIDKDGRFRENYDLQPGLNTFEIVAKRFLGKETKVVKQIIYQPEQVNPKL